MQRDPSWKNMVSGVSSTLRQCTISSYIRNKTVQDRRLRITFAIVSDLVFFLCIYFVQLCDWKPRQSLGCKLSFIRQVQPLWPHWGQDSHTWSQYNFEVLVLTQYFVYRFECEVGSCNVSKPIHGRKHCCLLIYENLLTENVFTTAQI